MNTFFCKCLFLFAVFIEREEGDRETREERDSENLPYAGQHPIKDFQGTFQGSLDQLLSVGSGADVKELEN